jgi:hypothetical protein
MNRFLLMIAVYLIALFFSGCIMISTLTMPAKWEKAAKEDTIASYKDFIANEDPDREYENKARTRIRELEAKKKEKDEAAAFEVARRQESSTSDKERKEKALQDFLSKYPSGKHAAEAKKLIEQAAEANKKMIEQVAFEKAKTTNTASAIMDFISKYPKSDLIPEANTRLRKIRYDSCRATGSPSSTVCMEFIKQYPEGPEAKELENDALKIKKLEQDMIAKKLEKQKFEKAKELGRIALRMAPVIVEQTKVLQNGLIEQRYPSKVVPPADIKVRLDQFRRMLKDGADPTLIRIKNFKAHYSNGLETSYGHHGEVVSAKEGGISLLEYFRLINVKEGADLLRIYTVK